MHPAAPTEQAPAAMIQGVRAKGLTLVAHPGTLKAQLETAMSRIRSATATG